MNNSTGTSMTTNLSKDYYALMFIKVEVYFVHYYNLIFDKSTL